MSINVIKAESRERQKQDRLAGKYVQFINDMITAKLTRREIMKLGLATGGGLLYGLGMRRACAAALPGITLPLAAPMPFRSPPNTPFVEAMPLLNKATPLSPDQLLPNATVGQNPNPSAVLFNGLGTREARIGAHQHWDEFLPSTCYEVVAQEHEHSFYPVVDGVPSSRIWDYVDRATGNAGPMQYVAHYGKPVVLRVHNTLPEIPAGGQFGINQTSLHLHNGHTASESDGGPTRFFDAGKFYDYHYCNARAGFASNYPTSTWNGNTVPGDVLETMTTLWLHDHRFDFTAQNTYKGLVAGFYTLFSDDINLDTGSELTGLRLPSGQFDVPMLFSDKLFDPTTGEQFFDLANFDGILGDKFAVNGKIQPYFEVKRRKYRFRLLTGGPSRYYEFFLSNKQNFIQLSSDGNFLPAPLIQASIRLAPSERKDVIIDFSILPIGTKIRLQNRLEQKDGRGTSGKIIAPIDILEFRVVADAIGEDTDNSRIPTTLLPLPSTNVPISKARSFKFEFSSGVWLINGKLFNPLDAAITTFPKQNTAEKWIFTSGGGWTHPIHKHFEEFQILRRDGNKPTGDDRSRKDTVTLGDGAISKSGSGEVEVFMQFRDFLGDYPLHCHNTIHEDHAMMLRFKVIP